jgi:hypothetical protein
MPSANEVDRPDPTLAALLDDLAGEFADVVRSERPDAVTYEIAGRPFATLTGARAEFRLRPEIAAAAARTPDARLSERGNEWVAFEPRDVDQHAIDRAQAWFELGHRLATTTH